MLNRMEFHPGASRTLQRRLCATLLGALLSALPLAAPSHAQEYDPAAHTDPINLTPQVREAHEHFYNLD